MLILWHFVPVTAIYLVQNIDSKKDSIHNLSMLVESFSEMNCQTSFENLKPSNFIDLVNNCTIYPAYIV